MADSVLEQASNTDTLLNAGQALLIEQDTKANSKPALDPIVSRGSIMRMVLSLAFILVLIYGGAWLFRRSQLNSLIPGQSLRVVAALSVGAREKVLLLQVGEQQVLVGVAPGRVNLLQHYETPALVLGANDGNTALDTKASGLTGDFTKILKQAVSKQAVSKRTDTEAGVG